VGDLPQFIYCGTMVTSNGGSSGKLLAVPLNARQARSLERIRTELATLGPCLPGSVVVRTGRCGKEACVCRADPPRLHGPFRSWTRKVAKKTVTRLLSEEELADYQGFFDNERRLKELLKELEELGLTIVEADHRSKR
jgi:hypothetical protein